MPDKSPPKWRLPTFGTVSAAWRLWVRLGWNDILQRYRRSLLGPFWLTASMAIMVVSLGVLYAELFNTPIDDFLPFLCVGLLVWNLLASFLTEGGTIFTAAESYIKQIRLPYSIYVYRSSWSKLIIFAHNFVIYFGVLIYFAIWPGATALLAIPGLMLVIFNGALATVFIGIISARFRDIPQVINSVVQIDIFCYTDHVEAGIAEEPKLYHRFQSVFPSHRDRSCAVAGKCSRPARTILPYC